MKTFRKFPSIQQFANVVKQVRAHSKYHDLPLPIIKFTGSVKLHGTNAAVGFSPDGDVWFQSRERLLSYESDNAGFATWGEQNIDIFKEIYRIVCEENQLEHTAFYIYGEWCCGSIQASVALNQIQEKKFAIFEMIFVDGVDVQADEEAGIEYKAAATFNVNPCNYHLRINTLLSNTFVVDYVVPPIEVEIDFASPHLVQNFLSEQTIKIEDECPVGKYFGVSGIGEGLVWSPEGYDQIGKFKTKGEKHSNSKVKTVHELTDAEIASKENAGEFVEYALTENRLQQGIDKLGEMGLPVDIKSMGAYLKWIGGDILTECKDVLIESKIERKDVMPRVADKARNWFLNYLNTEIGLAA